MIPKALNLTPNLIILSILSALGFLSQKRGFWVVKMKAIS